MNGPYDSRLANLAAHRIEQDIAKKQGEFKGKINRADAAATGLNCAELVGILEGLRLGLIHLQDAYNEMSGKPIKKKDDNG